MFAIFALSLLAPSTSWYPWAQDLIRTTTQLLLREEARGMAAPLGPCRMGCPQLQCLSFRKGVCLENPRSGQRFFPKIPFSPQ